MTYQSHDGVELKEEDVIVDSHVNNYGLRDQNPIDFIRFYNSAQKDESFALRSEEISALGPKTFAEKYIRIFCRSTDADKVQYDAFIRK